MTQIAYGIAFPASRGVLTRQTVLPLDGVDDVTITGAWSNNRPLLTSFGTGDLFRVRDTSGAGTSFEDVSSPGEASTFLGANAGAIVSLYDQSGNSHALTNATATQQPAFATGVGALSRAGADFDATDDLLVGPIAPNFFTAAEGYVIAVARFNALTLNAVQRYANQTVWNITGTNAGVSGRSGGFVDSCIWDGTGDYAEGATVVVSEPFVHEWWHAAGVLYSRANGGDVFQTPAGDVFSFSTSRFGLGKNGGAPGAMNGTWMEMAVMSARPATADSIVSNMMAYYGVAT